MIGVTVFGLFVTPLFYFVVGWLVERKSLAAAVVSVQSSHPPALVPAGSAVS
jgi:hypothetical protein